MANDSSERVSNNAAELMIRLERQVALMAEKTDIQAVEAKIAELNSRVDTCFRTDASIEQT
jgi:hypothetical protein